MIIEYWWLEWYNFPIKFWRKTVTKEQLVFENWNLFWNAFGAIGTTIGSFITACAVIVAVKQYRQPFVKKIKIDFSLAMVNFEETPKPYYVIKFINTGIRECKITSMYIRGKKSNLFIFPPSQIPRYNNPQFPCFLPQEESCEIFFGYDDFRKLVSKQFENGWKPKYKRLRLYITDSAGNIYFQKFKIKMSGFKK